MKLHGVKNFSKTPFGNRNSWIIHHTTLRISSTSMIQHSASTLEVRRLNRRIQRFSFPLSFFPCCLCKIMPQFLRRRCRILYIVEDRRVLSFLNRWSFKNVSHNGRSILCFSRPHRHTHQYTHHTMRTSHLLQGPILLSRRTGSLPAALFKDADSATSSFSSPLLLSESAPEPKSAFLCGHVWFPTVKRTKTHIKPPLQGGGVLTGNDT